MKDYEEGCGIYVERWNGGKDYRRRMTGSIGSLKVER